MIHYAGWLARRWDDPAFPAAFPWFNTQRYWQDHILALREQAAALDEPPLSLITLIRSATVQSGERRGRQGTAREDAEAGLRAPLCSQP